MLKTKMMNMYLFKLAFRIVIFLAAFVLYIWHKDWMIAFAKQPITMGVTPMHVLWLVFMVMMVKHLIPWGKATMALLKAEEENFVRTQGYSELEMYRFIQDQNEKAWKVMLLWLSFNAVWGLLYLLHILDDMDLIMLSITYFLCDYICILFYCPFQTHIMKNKCCVNCRIYDWGHFMMFTPMLFIRNFYSWSLFFTACVVLIHWEIKYIRHPERFWAGSNDTLQCENCKDKTCQIKKKLLQKIS
ncbi:MAG: hypothetical protein NC347_08645 [Clostridium sp.]|nr:hypothetical protein [Clostridium sp.]